MTRVARVTATSVASGRANTRRPVGAGVAKATVVKLTVVAADTKKTLALIAYAPATVKTRLIATRFNFGSAVVTHPAVDAVTLKATNLVPAHLTSKHTAVEAFCLAFVDVSVTPFTFPSGCTIARVSAINNCKRTAV